MFQLTIHPREGEARSYLLNRAHVSIGSSPECDVVLAGPQVEPVAARLDWETDSQGFRLVTGLGVRSLTVNGEPVISILLKDGDLIQSHGFIATIRAVAHGLSPAWEQASAGAQGVASRIEDLEGVVLRQLAELEELRSGHALLEGTKRQLEQANQALEEANRDLEKANRATQDAQRELEEERQRFAAFTAKAERERTDPGRIIAELQTRLTELETRLAETESDTRRRVERAHETIANLRKVITQQDGELREQRQNILKLQQAKNAAETQLEALRKSYSRDRKQHGRLLDQFRERARRETARADRALDELARTRQDGPEPEQPPKPSR